MGDTKESYQLDQFKNLSNEINRPLNKTSRIKVVLSIKYRTFQLE